MNDVRLHKPARARKGKGQSLFPHAHAFSKDPDTQRWTCLWCVIRRFPRRRPFSSGPSSSTFSTGPICIFRISFWLAHLRPDPLRGGAPAHPVGSQAVVLSRGSGPHREGPHPVDGNSHLVAPGTGEISRGKGDFPRKGTVSISATAFPDWTASSRSSLKPAFPVRLNCRKNGESSKSIGRSA